MFPSKGNWLIYFKTKWKALLHKFCVYVLNALHKTELFLNHFFFYQLVSAFRTSLLSEKWLIDWVTFFSFSGLQLINAFHDAKTEMTHDTAFHIFVLRLYSMYSRIWQLHTYLAWKPHNHFSFIVGYLIYPFFLSNLYLKSNRLSSLAKYAFLPLLLLLT